MTALAVALALAFIGGCLGACLGGNLAFSVVAVLAPICWTVTAVTGSPFALDQVAFGPLFGPHVGFAGGGAATIYAARRGLIPSGRLVNLSLATLRDPRVIAVGGCFGALGELLRRLVLTIPWLGARTDAIALSVVIGAFIARFVFGDRTVVNRSRFKPARTMYGRIQPTDEHCWLPHQQQPRHYLLLGAGVGSLAGAVTLALGRVAPQAAGMAHVVMFGVCGWAVIALTAGRRAYVTHHIAIIGGLAAFLAHRAYGISTAGLPLALMAAGLAGVAAAWTAEHGARAFLNRSDSFIDPPALAIWPLTAGLHALFPA